MKKEVCNAFGKVFLTIEYNSNHHLVHNSWVGYQTLDSIIMGANVCIEVLEHFKCSFLLNDYRAVVGPWDHATDWIANDWAPRAIKAGLTHFAQVVGPEPLAALSAETMNVIVGDSLQMSIFCSFSDAQCWLQEAREFVL